MVWGWYYSNHVAFVILKKKQCKHIADDAGMTSFVFEAKQRKYVYKLSMQCSKSTCNT